MGWDELLRMLADRPRENGTAALYDTATFLREVLSHAGIESRTFEYVAYPHRLGVIGVVALLQAIAYAVALRRHWSTVALALAVLVPGMVIVELDWCIPVLGWMGGSAPAQHVIAEIGPAQPKSLLLVTAHYDTKTDLLDHVERAPIAILALPVALLALGGALWARRRPGGKLARWVGRIVVVQGIGGFVVLCGGVVASGRSHGALDNGGSCAVLVQLAKRLAAAPLAHTAVRFVWLSGEEEGVQGSWRYAEQALAARSLPIRVINLEGMGAASRFAVFGAEQSTFRRYPPDPFLLARADEAHRARTQLPIHVTWYSGVTDARSFLAHEIPALTVMGDTPDHSFTRHLHSARDNRSRIAEAALDDTVTFLLEVLRRLDA